MRTCVECGITKDLSGFHKTQSGYRTRCRPCANARYQPATGRPNSGRYKKGHEPVAGFKKGRVSHNKGIPLSDETKKKMSAKLRGRKKSAEGRLNSALGHVRSTNRKSYVHRQWIAAINEKHDFRCAHCNSEDGLHAHHIKPWKEFPDLRFDVTNGILLCRVCHRIEEAKSNPKPAWNKGKKLTDEHRKNLSISHMGQAAWNKGKELPPLEEEHREKIAKSLKRRWDTGDLSLRTKEQRSESAKLGWKNRKAKF